MTRTAWLALALLALVPASAGAGTTRPPLALTATPARLALVGSGSTTVRVTNPGTSPIRVEADRAGFSLDVRGRPRTAPLRGPRAAARWVAVSPARFVVPPGASRSLAVSARLPGRIEPGDHDALVLLTTRPSIAGGVAVRVRLGVVVVVRAPGAVVRRLALGSLRVRRHRGASVLELWVANRGNVTETLGRGRTAFVVGRGTKRSRLLPTPRDLRPRTSGVLQLAYRGRLRGRVAVRAEILDGAGRVSRRTYRVRL